MNSAIPWGDYAPSQVEILISSWLSRVVPGAQRVDGAGGDDGADVRAPVDGGVHVFEIKSFYQRLTAANKRQISQSLATAVRRQPNMIRWTLVLPLDLSPAEIRWFEDTVATTVSVPIDYIGRTALESGLSEHRDLLRAFAPGSVERRAMDLVGELHAEQAAMPRGMIDGVQRAQQLRNQFDLTDPDYAFDLADLRPGQTTITVRPKDPQATSRRPLGGLLSFLVAEGSPMEKAIDDFMRYGRPVTIPSQNVAGVELDLPGGLGALIPPGAQPQVSIGQAGGEPGWRQMARLVAVRRGRVLATLPIEWNDSTRGPLGGHWLSGRDRSGFLEIAMQVDSDLRGGFTMRAPASDDVLPNEVLPVLRFLQVLKQADRVRLEAPGHETVETRVTGEMVGGPDVPGGGLAIAEALARIQDATGMTFPLPHRWTGKDADQVHFCDEILRSGSVTWYWPGAQVNVPVSSVTQLLQHGPIPRLSISGTSQPEPTIQLFGHRLPLPGVMRMDATNLLLANAPKLAAMIGQLPGWTTVTMNLAADDHTLCVFSLDEPATAALDDTPTGGRAIVMGASDRAQLGSASRPVGSVGASPATWAHS